MRRRCVPVRDIMVIGLQAAGNEIASIGSTISAIFITSIVETLWNCAQRDPNIEKLSSNFFEIVDEHIMERSSSVDVSHESRSIGPFRR
jgi:hypothetical protein